MRRRTAVGMIVGGAGYVSCSKETTLPTPVPTPPVPTSPPEPTPTPTLIGPLRILGDRFVPEIRGIAWCCADASAHGWPILNLLAIEKTVALGGNWSTMRLGPYSAAGESAQNVDQVSAYMPTADGRVDLTRWNEPFWNNVRTALGDAWVRGVYVEVDVFDGWALRTRNSALDGRQNIQGYDVAGCGATKRTLGEHESRWVREVAKRTGEYPNVMYQISNESFLCNPAYEWEAGIAEILEQNAPGRLIGSGAFPSLGDYATYHGTIPGGPRPALVNETDNNQSVAEYCSMAAREPYYMLWRGWKSDAEVAAAAACWAGGGAR